MQMTEQETFNVSARCKTLSDRHCCKVIDELAFRVI
ncbi:hypothetical protein ACZ87_03079, partial [Candidatus Erwinia dacicola]